MKRAYRKRQVGTQGRVPVQVNGLQINFCRNLECENFGIPPLPSVNRGRNPEMRDNYRAIGSQHHKEGADVSMLCAKCGQSFTLKSNHAVVEEFERQRRPFLLGGSIGCRSASCVNFGQSILQSPGLYQSFGKSEIGSRRYRCKACKKTFSVRQSATLRQRRPECNELVLKLLFNKMPMRRICEVADIEPAVLYNRIDYIHRQCLLFGRSREILLQNGMQFDHLGIAVDRQDHVFNWASQADRRNTQLSAAGSADCNTGYVFGFELDYEPDLNPYEVDLHAREIGDYPLAPPFRHYARLFLLGDYQGKGVKHPQGRTPLGPDTKLPPSGMRIHPEYVLMGHFHYLKWLLPGVNSFHFYLDQEPGIRAACISAFKNLVAERRVEAFFVRIAKSMTVDEKKLEVARMETLLKGLKAQYPNLSKRRIAIEVMKQRFVNARGKHRHPMDRWVESVLAHMGEPSKHVLYVTDRGDADPEIVAVAMLNASLHPIDRFFMQIRRRVSLLERPIATASSTGRTWYGYSCYNPQVAQKIMTSFRTIYNYCQIGQDGKTPAMRLGLAKHPITYDELLTFV